MFVALMFNRFTLVEFLALYSLILRSSAMENESARDITKDIESDSPTSEEILSRSRRYLLWNPLSVVQITVALAVPMRDVMEKSKNVGLAFDIQGNYPMPTRVEQLEPGFIPVAPGSRRLARDLTLQDTYKNFEQILYMQGLEGRSCLLQSICMTAEIPMSKDNFFEEIVHLLLSPSEIEPEVSEPYKEAQRLGESGADCRKAFPDCRKPILDIVSMIWHPTSQTNEDYTATNSAGS